tara:strand:+ start:885 stop:1445 length:561 start_codon:yes stop_codon:yes gene_type:complete
MSDGLLVLFNAIAVIIMVFCLYYPRHGRKDMIVALFAINIGVLGVSFTLADAAVSAGLGLGLFGVLSIIRLRSNELGQQEIAYYFCSLALGLVGGVNVDSWISPILMAAIIVAIFIGDHPQLFSASRQQIMRIDKAYTDEQELRDDLENMLNATIRRLQVQRVDLVNNSCVVDVRFTINDTGTDAK